MSQDKNNVFVESERVVGVVEEFKEFVEEYQNSRTFDLDIFADICYDNARDKGFWDNPHEELIKELEAGMPAGSLRNKVRTALVQAGQRNAAEMIALEHSELSERLEALRDAHKKGAMTMSEKAAGFTQEEEEAADAFIRLLDYCRGRRLRLAEAAIQKMHYNLSRPYKHGRNF